MAFEYTPPKYAQVISDLQRRIESGEYPPGSLLPSENQLSEQFGIARPTVVRALRVLRQEGWIETHQGKGSFVRGRPALAGVAPARPGQAELDREESTEGGELISTGLTAPPPRVANLLGTPAGGELLCRRRLIREEGEPSAIITWWLPASLASDTALTASTALRGTLRGYLDRHHQLRTDHVIEQVTARHPDAAEAKLLGIKRTAPLLGLYVTARDAAGAPLFALDVAMPGDLHELEDAYQVA
jgi:DNA-binding GntR family transcriptional regulator